MRMRLSHETPSNFGSDGTKLAKAVQHCRNEKAYLYRCLEDGNIPADNSRAEKAICPFVVGVRTGCLPIP